MTAIPIPQVQMPRVVVIGCGFGGLQLIKALRGGPFQLVMVDRNNYHTFQPLLYQVATSGLEADSIAYPIRKIFKGYEHFHFRWGQVEQIVPAEHRIITNIGTLEYDYLVIATGSTSFFFGNADFETFGMPMKTVTEALHLRSLILQNFEQALLTTDVAEREALMTHVIVGGGPTGVELAGSLCELKKHVLPNDYPELDFRKMRVILVENGGEVLQAMSPASRVKAKRYLEELGAEIWLETSVMKYDGKTVALSTGKQLHTHNLIWTAGVKGLSPQGLNAEAVNARGRILVDAFCRVKGYENIFAIGDVAALVSDEFPNGHPQVAPVAMQQGQTLAANLKRIQQKQEPVPFRYKDRGNMATVGRNRAVAEILGMQIGGFTGWLVWMALHLMMLVGFRNKTVVFVNWLWNYLNYDRHIRLIIRPFYRKESKPAAETVSAEKN